MRVDDGGGYSKPLPPPPPPKPKPKPVHHSPPAHIYGAPAAVRQSGVAHASPAAKPPPHKSDAQLIKDAQTEIATRAKNHKPPPPPLTVDDPVTRSVRPVISQAQKEQTSSQNALNADRTAAQQTKSHLNSLYDEMDRRGPRAPMLESARKLESQLANQNKQVVTDQHHVDAAKAKASAANVVAYSQQAKADGHAAAASQKTAKSTYDAVTKSLPKGMTLKAGGSLSADQVAKLDAHQKATYQSYVTAVSRFGADNARVQSDRAAVNVHSAQLRVYASDEHYGSIAKDAVGAVNGHLHSQNLVMSAPKATSAAAARQQLREAKDTANYWNAVHDAAAAHANVLTNPQVLAAQRKVDQAQAKVTDAEKSACLTNDAPVKKQLKAAQAELQAVMTPIAQDIAIKDGYVGKLQAAAGLKVQQAQYDHVKAQRDQWAAKNHGVPPSDNPYATALSSASGALDRARQYDTATDTGFKAAIGQQYASELATSVAPQLQGARDDYAAAAKGLSKLPSHPAVIYAGRGGVYRSPEATSQEKQRDALTKAADDAKDVYHRWADPAAAASAVALSLTANAGQQMADYNYATGVATKASPETLSTLHDRQLSAQHAVERADFVLKLDSSLRAPLTQADQQTLATKQADFDRLHLFESGDKIDGQKALATLKDDKKNEDNLVNSRGWLQSTFDFFNSTPSRLQSYIDKRVDEVTAENARHDAGQVSDAQYQKDLHDILANYGADTQQMNASERKTDSHWQTAEQVTDFALATVAGVATGGVAGAVLAFGIYQTLQGASDAVVATKGGDMKADGQLSLAAWAGEGFKGSDAKMATTTTVNDAINSATLVVAGGAGSKAAEAVAERGLFGLGRTGVTALEEAAPAAEGAGTAGGAAPLSLGQRVLTQAVGGTVNQAVMGTGQTLTTVVDLAASGQLGTAEGQRQLTNAVKTQGVYILTAPFAGAISGAMPGARAVDAAGVEQKTSMATRVATQAGANLVSNAGQTLATEEVVNGHGLTTDNWLSIGIGAVPSTAHDLVMQAGQRNQAKRSAAEDPPSANRDPATGGENILHVPAAIATQPDLPVTTAPVLTAAEPPTHATIPADPTAPATPKSATVPADPTAAPPFRTTEEPAAEGAASTLAAGVAAMAAAAALLSGPGTASPGAPPNPSPNGNGNPSGNASQPSPIANQPPPVGAGGQLGSDHDGRTRTAAAGVEWMTLPTGPEPGAVPQHVEPQQIAYVTSPYADNPDRTWALPTEKINSAAQAQVLDSVLGSGGRIANAKYGLASERTGQFSYFDSLSQARDAARAAGAKDEVFIVHESAPAGADIVDLHESGLIMSSARDGRVTSMWMDSSVAPVIALPPNARAGEPLDVADLNHGRINWFPRRAADMALAVRGEGYDRAVPAPEGFFVATIHGLNEEGPHMGQAIDTDGSVLDGAALAQRIAAHPGYVSGQPVLLYVCMAAEGHVPNVQAVADHLGTDVYASPARVRFSWSEADGGSKRYVTRVTLVQNPIRPEALLAATPDAPIARAVAADHFYRFSPPEDARRPLPAEVRLRSDASPATWQAADRSVNPEPVTEELAHAQPGSGAMPPLPGEAFPAEHWNGFLDDLHIGRISYPTDMHVYVVHAAEGADVRFGNADIKYQGTIAARARDIQWSAASPGQGKLTADYFGPSEQGKAYRVVITDADPAALQGPGTHQVSLNRQPPGAPAPAPHGTGAATPVNAVAYSPKTFEKFLEGLRHGSGERVSGQERYVYVVETPANQARGITVNDAALKLSGTIGANRIFVDWTDRAPPSAAKASKTYDLSHRDPEKTYRVVIADQPIGGGGDQTVPVRLSRWQRTGNALRIGGVVAAGTVPALGVEVPTLGGLSKQGVANWGNGNFAGRGPVLVASAVAAARKQLGPLTKTGLALRTLAGSSFLMNAANNFYKVTEQFHSGHPLSNGLAVAQLASQGLFAIGQSILGVRALTSATQAALVRQYAANGQRSGDLLIPVREGQSWRWIALKSGTPMGSMPVIMPGDSLVIPNQGSGLVHQAVPGDTLASIAEQYGVTARSLRRENDLGKVKATGVAQVPLYLWEAKNPWAKRLQAAGAFSMSAASGSLLPVDLAKFGPYAMLFAPADVAIAVGTGGTAILSASAKARAFAVKHPWALAAFQITSAAALGWKGAGHELAQYDPHDIVPQWIHQADLPK